MYVGYFDNVYIKQSVKSALTNFFYPYENILRLIKGSVHVSVNKILVVVS